MKVSGVILAGGKSSRMKSNKAFVHILGKPLINALIEKFEPYFDETIIISNEPHLFEGLAASVYTDIFPYRGPVSGIHSGLVHAQYDTIFVLGCDMPFINMDLVQYMVKKLGDNNAVVPEVDSVLQPLCAVYHRTALPVFTNCLRVDHLKLIRIFEELKAVVIPEPELERFGSVRDQFFNINDRDALYYANQIAGRYL
ncbi:MAG: molybdenum cofactor guanylyltransferase [Bacillota bacterium]|nr:molybdenum cofactor guanylyltransferase [Bacillota bacterium]